MSDSGLISEGERTSIKTYLDGTSEPSSKNLGALAKYFGVTADALMYGDLTGSSSNEDSTAKINYDELLKKFMDQSDANAILVKDNNRLREENDRLKKLLELRGIESENAKTA